MFIKCTEFINLMFKSKCYFCIQFSIKSYFRYHIVHVSIFQSSEDMCNTNSTSLVAQMVKNLPAMQETWVRSLGWEDALEKEMATHSSILAWRILWTEEPGGPRPMDSQLYVTKQLTHTHTHTHNAIYNHNCSCVY